MYLCNSLTILVNVKRKHISSNEALKKSFREEGKTCRGFLMTFLDLFQTGAGGGGICLLGLQFAQSTKLGEFCSKLSGGRNLMFPG